MREAGQFVAGLTTEAARHYGRAVLRHLTEDGAPRPAVPELVGEKRARMIRRVLEELVPAPRGRL